MPVPTALGVPGWFTKGTPGVSLPSVVTSDFMNALQAELLNVLAAAGIMPNTLTFSSSCRRS